ncbi:hypothetical protein LIER_43292 [Lithospermum erythrorhizon]|uniref:RNase H type-1 domain-containing protein n=1 Tax=Lithospermum erythrorhizon TaxID=34254 RepID=A0AAV3PUS2_LITER
MEHVPRERNQEADRLSKMAMAEYGTIPDSTLMEWVAEKAFRMKEVMDTTPQGEGTESWYQVILDFLRTGVLPENPPVAKKIQRQSLRYTLLDGLLYRRSLQGLLLKCVTQEEWLMAIEEMNEGMCGTHINGKALA